MEFKEKYTLIIGGNSDIGQALARDLARQGSHLYLTSRKVSQLDSFRSDIAIRYDVVCKVFELDILDFDSHQVFYDSIEIKPDIVLCAVGYLDNQEISEKTFSESLKSINTNYTGLVSLINIIAEDFRTRKTGVIVGISSVAGDRGRGSNYIYGSAKAAFSTYLNGLRNRLFKSNVHVLTVKPGFVDTKMTQHLQLPGLLTSSPEEVSKDIIKGIRKKRNIIYTKWFWRWIMLIIKWIPEAIFKKLKL